MTAASQSFRPRNCFHQHRASANMVLATNLQTMISQQETSQLNQRSTANHIISRVSNTNTKIMNSCIGIAGEANANVKPESEMRLQAKIPRTHDMRNSYLAPHRSLGSPILHSTVAEAIPYMVDLSILLANVLHTTAATVGRKNIIALTWQKARKNAALNMR